MADWLTAIPVIGKVADALSKAFQVLERVVHAAKNELEPDRRLFAELVALLPSSGVILFLKDHDMADAFRLERLFPVMDFCVQWDNAEHEFHDTRLEAKRRELLRVANEFRFSVAANTFANQNGFQSMSREWDREQFDAARKEMNDLADEIVEIHQDLVRTAKKRLRV